MSAAEIDIVANRMRTTLIEVEGEEVGTALYSLDWLRERVRWHLGNPAVQAKVLLATSDGEIIGHTIVRREAEAFAAEFGLISTTYVCPEFRGLGVATALLEAGERWFASLKLRSYATWTSSANSQLIKLYEKHGYTVTERHPHEVTNTLMVRLTKDVLCP